MAKEISTLSIKVDFKDAGAQAVIDRIGSSISKLKVISGPTSQTIQKLRQEVTQLGQRGNNSISTIEGQIGALKGLRREADLNSKEFKQLTGDIEKYTQKLQKAQGKQKKKGLSGRQVAQGVGTIAAAGIFGGPEGAAGALLGSIFGPGGAAAGAALGALLSSLRQTLGATAEYSANLGKLRIALAGVTTSQAEYRQSLDFIKESTKKFAIPQEILTKQFTRLQASVQGAGGNIDDTKTAFNGIVAAVRATGGSLTDVESALTATAQVFSKGKVSAEELRQQLGERLPGAFTLFAKSMGKTPAELDKALEGGKVSLQDFQAFAELLFDKYGETAQTIANSPKAAGDRLKVALSDLSEDVGILLEPIGAAFQETFLDAVKAVNDLIIALNKLFGLGEAGLQAKLDRLTRKLNALPSADVSPQAARSSGTGIVQTSEARASLTAQINEVRKQLQKIRLPDVEQAKEGSGLPGLNDDPSNQAGRSPLAALNRDTNRAFAELETTFKNLADARNRSIRDEFDLQIERARSEGDDRLAFTLSQEKELAKVETVIDGLTNQIAKRKVVIAEASAKGADVSRQQNKLSREQSSLLILQESKISLIAKQELERLGFERKRTEEIEKQSKAFEAQFLDRQRQLGLISRDAYNAALLRREEDRLGGIKELTPEQRARGFDQYRQTIDPTLGEGLRANISNLRNELFELTNPINAITNAATNIGTAFSNSFSSIISGSATTQEALASFFKNIGNFFLDMAAQIIQKMITMFILNKVVGLLPGMSGGGGGDIFSDIALRGGLRMADGGVFAKNKIIPYAKGGIVNRPTMFAYANGGAGRFGIMGEAGPEAILPLRRGPGGKLGVESSGGVGNVVVNVDASGSSVEGDGDQAGQLGKMLGAAVQAELIKQKRPGGLLA
jgi:lambda family phage tail tape measure protein